MREIAVQGRGSMRERTDSVVCIIPIMSQVSNHTPLSVDQGVWPMVEVPLATAVWGADASAATTPQYLFRTLSGNACRRQVVGDGTNDPRIAETHVQRVQAQPDGQADPETWLPVRLGPESGERKAVLSNAPAATPLARLIQVHGQRWPIEQCIEVGKQQVGMRDHAVRRWTGWHYPMTLVILAHFFLVHLQRRLKKSPDGEPGAGGRAVQRALPSAPAHG